MIFGMLDFSLMDYMAVEDFFTEHVRTSAPPGDPEGMDYTTQCFCFRYLVS